MNDDKPPAIDTRGGFIEALHWGFARAFAQPARRILCADPSFAEWPLDEPALLQGLTDWLKRPQRRLVLLARQYEDLPRRCPRFTAWRNSWTHAIDAWVAPDDLARDLPSVLASDGAVSVHLIDAVHWRGRAELDERRARQWCEQLDVVLQRSERGFAANTLGL
jgi:hypothetical protein